NSNNEDGFIIERSDEGAGYNVIATANSGVTPFEDNVSQAIDYSYRVKAYNASDTSGYSNVTCVNGSIVPVEISLFTIEISKDESSVILLWETASETNNRGFEIERNLDGVTGNWASIGFMEGKGTTTEK